MTPLSRSFVAEQTHEIPQSAVATPTTEYCCLLRYFTAPACADLGRLTQGRDYEWLWLPVALQLHSEA